MSPDRIGARQLADIARALTDRDRAILDSVASHRFLTTTQIAAWHFHDHHTPLAGMRACTRVLARLRSHRLLARLDRRIGGVRKGSASYVWHLDVAGQRLHQQTTGQTGRRRIAAEPSTEFLDHTLAIADTHLLLVRAARAGLIELLDVEIEPACWRRYLNAHGTATTLRPDLAMVTATGEFEDHWYLEVDRGTEPLTRLLSKCHQYTAYRAQGIDEARLGVFPAVVWILPTTARADALHRALDTDPVLDPALFHVTTPQGLIDLVTTGPDRQSEP